MRNFLLILYILIASLAYSSEINKQIDAIESMAKEKLSKINLTDKEKFFVYLMAGRELYHYHLFLKSKEYYQMAESLNVEENKLEVYVNLISIELNSKNKIEAEKRITKIEDYLKKFPQYQNEEVSQFIDLAKASISVKDFKTNKEIPSFYGNYIAHLQLAELIKTKQYSTAISYLNLENIKNSNNIILETNYDLLNVLVNKKGTKKLLCENTLKKYPNSLSYSLMICDSLVSFLKNKKLDKLKINKLEEYFKRFDQDKDYYLSALKDLEQ